MVIFLFCIFNCYLKMCQLAVIYEYDAKLMSFDLLLALMRKRGQIHYMGERSAVKLEAMQIFTASRALWVYSNGGMTSCRAHDPQYVMHKQLSQLLMMFSTSENTIWLLKINAF